MKETRLSVCKMMPEHGAGARSEPPRTDRADTHEYAVDGGGGMQKRRAIVYSRKQHLPNTCGAPEPLAR